MTINATHVSVSQAGDIRWTGDAATQYTVLELHRYLQDLADDAQASGDDIVDITSSTPSERSTDQIITLLGTFNIDDTMAQHLYGGSITQSSGDVIYSGLRVVGSLYSGTSEPQIIQNNVALPNYWGTGLNADAAANVIMRVLVKTRTGGADIDNKKVRVQVRELGDTFAEFEATLGQGESVAAVFTQQDLNNATAEATIAGWTTIANTEGYQLIDLGNGAGNRPYYSQWDKSSYSINQLYERTKWIQKRALTEDSYTAAESKDNPVGNASIVEQSQSFEVGANDVHVTRVRFKLKATGSPTGNMTAKVYAHTGTYGTSSEPTGAALATSEAIPATRLRTSYDEIEFVFNGAQQATLSNGTYYCVTLAYSGGDGSNYVNVAGVDSTGHDGNRADYIAAWAPDATDDLWFELYTSPIIHTMSGELFRGITHEFTYNDENSGPFLEDEILSWGSGATAGTGILLALKDDGATGTMWIQLLTGIAPTAAIQIDGGTSGADCDTVAVTARTVPPNFLGQSTGSAIIGAFGIGVDPNDLTQNDKLFDLTNAQQTPPNNVTWTLSSVVSGEDRILVGPKAAGNDFDWDQLSLADTLDQVDETSIVVTTPIPNDTPSSGTVRVQLDSGIYKIVSYTSWSGYTFTIAETDFTGDNVATAANYVMITYIDKLALATSESFTTIFSGEFSLYVRVRDGGGTPIKTFESPSTLTSAGGGASAIRTTDA